MLDSTGVTIKNGQSRETDNTGQNTTQYDLDVLDTRHYCDS